MRQEQLTASEWTLRRPGGALALLRKFWAVLSITVAARFAYLGELLVRTIFLVLILYIFAQLWRATNSSTAEGVQRLTGFSIAQLIWYLAFTEAMVMSATPPEVDREVRSGDIAYRLARPLPYPLYHLGAMLGERLLRFALNLVVGALVALVVVGPVTITPLALLAALSTALVALLADRMIAFTIGLIAFWVEDVSGLYLLYSRAIMILGGTLIPLEAYPDWLAVIARALPFQYLMYQPARLLVSGDVASWLRVLSVQLLVIAVVLVPMLLIYRLGLRRVNAQGG